MLIQVACYDRGGVEATVSDANLVLGRLQFDSELAGNLTLSLEKARASIKALAEEIGLSIEETAMGIIDIANEHMAKAIRLISVNRVYDPKEFVLTSFGGAGGLHVCALAMAMGMNKAIVPVHGGVLSALGMVVAEQGRQFSKTVNLDCKSIDEGVLEKQFQQLECQGIEQLKLGGLELADLVVQRSADFRYCGQSYTLNIDWQTLSQSLKEFEHLHQQRYGYCHSSAVELLNIRANVSTSRKFFNLPKVADVERCNNIQYSKVYGQTEQAKILARSDLRTGQLVKGPAIITEYAATIFVEQDWSAETDKFGNLILNKQM